VSKRLSRLSITGSYASKGLEIMFLEHKVVTNNQGLKIGDDAPKFVVVSNDLKEVTVGGAKDNTSFALQNLENAKGVSLEIIFISTLFILAIRLLK
jgi:hypothetical protein